MLKIVSINQIGTNDKIPTKNIFIAHIKDNKTKIMKPTHLPKYQHNLSPETPPNEPNSSTNYNLN